MKSEFEICNKALSYSSDASKAKSRLGCQPIMSQEDGLKK